MAGRGDGRAFVEENPNRQADPESRAPIPHAGSETRTPRSAWGRIILLYPEPAGSACWKRRSEVTGGVSRAMGAQTGAGCGAIGLPGRMD